MKKIVLFVSVLLFVFTVGISTAEEGATKDEVVAKCKAAATMVAEKGLEETIKVIMDKNGPFVWKNTYVFIVDMDTKFTIAHPIKPKLMGKNFMHIKDKGGKMFYAEFVNVAKDKGEGWVEYLWPKPGEKKPSIKQTYVYKVLGKQLFTGAGIYK